MRHHFHRCPYLRVLEVDAGEINGKRRGASVILEELCEARHLARCLGLVECRVLSLPEKRNLLVARATRLREEEIAPPPLAGTEGRRREQLEVLRASLEAERERIVERNRQRDAECAFLAEIGTADERHADWQSPDLNPAFQDVVGDLEAERLDTLDRALHAMANVDYGLCISCGGWIGIDRLELVPDSRVCASCAEKALPSS